MSFRRSCRSYPVVIALLLFVFSPVSRLCADNLGAIGAGAAVLFLLFGIPALLSGLATIVIPIILAAKSYEAPSSPGVRTLAAVSIWVSVAYLLLLMLPIGLLWGEINDEPYSIMIAANASTIAPTQ